MEGINLETAIEILLNNVAPIDDVETVSLINSIDRVTATDILARFDNPPFDRSPLDGYALNSSFTKGATADLPNEFEIVGEECAGDFFNGELIDRQALRIMTGAAMPRGSDCVIRQEDVRVDGDRLFVPYELRHHENYCFAGEDVAADSILIKRGVTLKAAHIGVIAGQGVETISVYRRPKIAIASTGDELVDIGAELTRGKIYNSNLYLLTARLIELGFDPQVIGIMSDDADSIVDAVKNLRCDLFVTTGGVSVGKKDIMHDVVKNLRAERLFWRVMMKPGAPALAYKFNGMLGLALSGNPFAAYATFELLTRPILAKISRREDVMYRRNRAVLMNDFDKESRGRRFIRGRHVDGKIYLPQNHASGSLASSMDCNAFVDVAAGSGALKSGATVDVVLL